MKSVLTNFTESPDTGRLKKDNGEYSFLQNIRGFGGLGSKRFGIRTSDVLTSGIMGIFDLKIEGVAETQDKIIIITANGDVNVYDYSELIAVFNYLIADGASLVLQSANSSWWDIDPQTGNGVLRTEGVAAPSSTRSTDLNVKQGELFGFADSTGIWGRYVQEQISVGGSKMGFLRGRRYALHEATTTYSTDLAFTTGSGPVFQTSDLQRWRWSVTNQGISRLTSI